MAETLTNGTFDSDLSSWAKHGGSSRTMFTYDATGASHDGGATKARHAGVGLTLVRYSMYQNITISEASNIDTATMDIWGQLATYGTVHVTEILKSYIQFTVNLVDPDGNFHRVQQITRYYISSTALRPITILSDEDVKSILQAGGNGTWSIIVAAFIYRANFGTGELRGWYDDLSLDISYHAYGSTTETITLSDTTSLTLELSDSHTDTITLSDSGALSVSADPTFGYYFGSYDGKVYYEDSSYKSDDGTSIPARWESKETDFAEEGMDAHDKFKTIYKVRLWYVDISSIVAPVTISIKADGGATWSTIAENIGGSDNDTNKCKDFYIIKSGNSFKFRIEHDSTNNEFQWSALEVYYTLGGDYFQ